MQTSLTFIFIAAGMMFYLRVKCSDSPLHDSFICSQNMQVGSFRALRCIMMHYVDRSIWSHLWK